MSTPELATFWHGPLNPLVSACLASFAHVGAALRLYSYDKSIDAPPGVEVADARAICPDQSLLDRYVVGGKPSIAMFADMFRYQMIAQTGCCWVDADLVCLRKPDFAGEQFVFGRQPEARGEALVNNAVLRLPPGHPVLDALIQAAADAVDVDTSWGAIGPFLLNELVKRHGIARYAREPFHFYPLDADRFAEPFLPACRERVAADTKAATFLHLWSEMLVRAGRDLSARPPAGSFLHDAFARIGALERFAPAGPIRA